MGGLFGEIGLEKMNVMARKGVRLRTQAEADSKDRFSC